MLARVSHAVEPAVSRSVVRMAASVPGPRLCGHQPVLQTNPAWTFGSRRPLQDGVLLVPGHIFVCTSRNQLLHNAILQYRHATVLSQHLIMFLQERRMVKAIVVESFSHLFPSPLHPNLVEDCRPCA